MDRTYTISSNTASNWASNNNTNNTTTGAYGNKTQYEKERDKLISGISQDLEASIKGMNQLVRNLESAVLLGSQFDKIAELWKEFGTIIAPPHESVDDDYEENGEEDQDVDNQEADQFSSSHLEDDTYDIQTGGNGHCHSDNDDDELSYSKH